MVGVRCVGQKIEVPCEKTSSTPGVVTFWTSNLNRGNPPYWVESYHLYSISYHLSVIFFSGKWSEFPLPDCLLDQQFNLPVVLGMLNSEFFVTEW